MMMVNSMTLFIFACLSGHVVLADTASLRQKFTALKIDAVFPGDLNYEKFSTPFNKRLSYMPAAIVFPSNTNAVASCVKVGVAEKFPISPRAGGHSYAAYGLGGTNGALIIDLQRINQISVDSGGEATIGTGSRLGDIALSLNREGGRALPHGFYGLTSRQWGLTIDQLLGHEVVLGNGSVITTSKTATNFAYDWHLSEAEVAGALIKLQTYCMSNLPAQLGLTANLRKSTQSGKVTFSFTGAWYGAQNAFSSVVQPFLSQMPTPAGNSVKTTDWITSLQGLAGDRALSTSGVDLTREHDTFYAKSITTPQLAPMSNSSIRAFSKYLATQGIQSNTVWFVQLELYGGKNSAVTTVPADGTAFAQRAILFTIQFYASSYNFAPPYPAAGFALLDNMVDSIVNNNPLGWSYGAYANYVDDRLSPVQWKSLYYKNHYKRLTQIKGLYDPQNVFVHPQSITEPTHNCETDDGVNHIIDPTHSDRGSLRPPQPTADYVMSNSSSSKTNMPVFSVMDQSYPPLLSSDFLNKQIDS
ncbi:hypothetical protein PtB15_4B287 [Puccinia triticina]|nr:hypothetical protein PtB15_4B287 [Puccinia triticina]